MFYINKKISTVSSQSLFHFIQIVPKNRESVSLSTLLDIAFPFPSLPLQKKNSENFLEFTENFQLKNEDYTGVRITNAISVKLFVSLQCIFLLNYVSTGLSLNVILYQSHK